MNTPTLDCFLDDVARDLAQDVEAAQQFARCRGSKWLVLNNIPETAVRNILQGMKRAAEATLEGKLPGWLRERPADREGQEGYLEVVRQLLYHTKQDLGLASPLPPRQGECTFVKVSLLGMNYDRHLPYWIAEAFFGAGIATCPAAVEDVRDRLVGAIVESRLVLPWTIEVPILVSDRRVLCVLKSAAEATLQGEVPHWLQGPANEEGRRIYVSYVTEMLAAITKAIEETDAFIAELQPQAP